MSSQKKLKVVLLAGGPGGQLVQDILAATSKPPHIESKLAGRRVMLRGNQGSEYVPLGLVNICGTTVLQSWLTALKYCGRVKPGNVYVVCNECDKTELQKMLSAAGCPSGFATLVSNNCMDPANHWQGEVPDLQAAVAAMGTMAETPYSLLAISCSLLLLPEHNLSRIIEHALVWGGDVCCYSHLSATDIQLGGAGGSNNICMRVSTDSAGGPVPAIDTVEAVPSSHCCPGDAVLEPMMLLSPATLKQMGSFAASHQQPRMGITALAAALLNSNRLYGIDLGAPGRLHVDSLLWLEYADTVWYSRCETLDKTLHEERAAVANTGGKGGRGVLATSNAGKPIGKPGSINSNTTGAGLGTCNTGNGGSCSGSNSPVANMVSGGLTSKAAMAVMLKQVDTQGISSALFFKKMAAINSAGIQQPYYHLPASFYSSEYARDAATGVGMTLLAGGMAVAGGMAAAGGSCQFQP